MPLDAAVVRAASMHWHKRWPPPQARQRTPEEVAEGFLKIAVDNMAHAIKHISVERGYDVTEYTLCCFGGAGGQHACAVADALGMTRVFIHPLAGVLSAYGMGLADVRALRQHAVEAVLDPAALATAGPLFARLADAARGEVEAQGIDPTMIELQRTVHLKYDGTDTDARDPVCPVAGRASGRCHGRRPGTAFERRYSAQYGFLMRDKALVIEAVAVEAIGVMAIADESPRNSRRVPTGYARRSVAVFSPTARGATHLCILREALRPGDVVAGPAVIAEKNATTVIEPGWKAALTARDHLYWSARSP